MYNPCNKSSLCDSTVESRQDECERDYEEEVKTRIVRTGRKEDPEGRRGTRRQSEGQTSLSAVRAFSSRP